MNISFNYELKLTVIEEDTYPEEGMLYMEFEKPAVWVSEQYYGDKEFHGYIHAIHSISICPRMSWSPHSYPLYCKTEAEKADYMSKVFDEMSVIVNKMLNLEYTDEELLSLIPIDDRTFEDPIRNYRWMLSEIPDKELQQEIIKAFKKAIIEYML